MYNDTDKTIRDLTDEEFEACETIFDLPLYQEFLRRKGYRRHLMKKKGGAELIAEYDRRFPDRVLVD